MKKSLYHLSLNVHVGMTKSFHSIWRYVSISVRISTEPRWQNLPRVVLGPSRLHFPEISLWASPCYIELREKWKMFFPSFISTAYLHYYLYTSSVPHQSHLVLLKHCPHPRTCTGPPTQRRVLVHANGSKPLSNGFQLIIPDKLPHVSGRWQTRLVSLGHPGQHYSYCSGICSPSPQVIMGDQKGVLGVLIHPVLTVCTPSVLCCTLLGWPGVLTHGVPGGERAVGRSYSVPQDIL